MGSKALKGQKVAPRLAHLVAVDGDRTVVVLTEARPCSCGVMAMLMINRSGRTKCSKCDASASESAGAGVTA